jgi:tetratricopeptide (TPR) repeat protein
MPRPNRLRGLIHKDFERYDLAAVEYREALRRSPDPDRWDEVRVELADCLRREGKFAEALEVLEPCEPLPDADALASRMPIWPLEQPDQATRWSAAPGRRSPNIGTPCWSRPRSCCKPAKRSVPPSSWSEPQRAHPRDDLVRYRLAQVYRRLGP